MTLRELARVAVERNAEDGQERSVYLPATELAALLDTQDALVTALDEARARILDFCEVSDLMPDSTAELLNRISDALERAKEAK